MGQRLILQTPQLPEWVPDWLEAFLEPDPSDVVNPIGPQAAVGPLAVLAKKAGKAAAPEVRQAIKVIAEKIKGIKAFHGSPHDFDKFSLEKIGTGEGAQTYGHGLYFAEAEDTARAYRDALSPGRGAGAADVAKRVLDAVGGDRAKAIAEIRTRIRRAPLEADHPLHQALQLLESDAPVGGRMYEVRINADPEHFLDWDKPLREQSEFVRTRVERLPRNPSNPSDMTIGDDPNMQDVIGRLIKDFAGGEQKLLERGIPGIRYLDQGSRAAGDGTRNYVVFDDALIEMLRKYGLLLPLTGGAGAALLQQEQN